ncbi:MAG: GTP-binding protein [Spirochaetes bacterium]|nr:GTP-binding protein [Spirochaetota bacterium]
MPHRNTANQAIRNIAIIAHVDHGKTTLVDGMFRQSGVFRDNQETRERLMDNMDIERERGITIAAKNCSISWKGVKINILDTPGHADFGGEVERALSMVDGAILLVDASEGPLPQTRFVLNKALQAGHKIIVVINKIDRPDARPQAVLNDIYDLFIDLDAGEAQIEFPLLYANGRAGIVQRTLEEQGENMHVLFDTILECIPAPAYSTEEPFQMLVSDLSYSEYFGRLAIGKVVNGSVHSKDLLVRIGEDSGRQPLNVSRLQVYSGPALKDTATADPGDIIVLAGIDEVHIGDTICTREAPKALKRISVDEPTVSMFFTINDSPFSGREGRGEFQMVILVEMLRRDDFELSVGRPQVIFRHEKGKKLEPVEHLSVECEEVFVGVVTQKLTARKCRMLSYVNHERGRIRLEFSVPSRALIGYRDEFLTDTKGTGMLNSYFTGYEEYRGDFPERFTGSLVADRQGVTVVYAIFNLEPRGQLFVIPNEQVYEGMIVGEHNRDNDLNVNICKTKKLTNIRAAGKDEAVTLTPVSPMTLERAIQFIRDDELVEVTPKSIRLRKAILQAQARKTAGRG